VKNHVDAHIVRLNAFASAAGLQPLCPEPLVLDKESVGNTSDHVAPSFKDAATRRYAVLISARLAGVDPDCTMTSVPLMHDRPEVVAAKPGS
jgi:hypothetical protein